MEIPYRWINDDDGVATLAAALNHGQRLYLDTEFMRERTFYPKLALVQINDGRENLLVDPSPLEETGPLCDVLAQRPLVMHGCSEDLETLRTWPGILPSRIEDTQIGAALAGYDLQCGYQRIVELMLGVALPKTATRTDWLQRPLSEQQLEYAVQDVHYLPAVHEKVVKHLEQRGRMAWWAEECDRLLQEADRQPDPKTLWQQVKGAATLDGPGRRRLKSLAAWRDRQARRADLPRSFVVRDEQMLLLARENPGSPGALANLDLHPSFVRRHGERVLALLEDARSGPEPAPLPGPPDLEVRNLMKQLRKRAGEVAEQLEVTPEVLVRRKWMEALVRDPGNPPAALTGWRMDIVTRPLLEVMS